MRKCVYFKKTTGIGEILLASTQDGICWLEFLAPGKQATALFIFCSKNHLHAVSGVSPRLDQAVNQLEEYLNSRRKRFDLDLDLTGTPFQKSVWSEMLKIPFGQTRSYGEIAAALGNPRAARAVGMAANRNPVAIFVPCHRVIGKDGSLVGFGGGLDLKKRLLALEGNG